MKKNNLFGALKLLLNRFFAVFCLILVSLAAIGTMLNKDNVVFCSQILWLALFSLLIAVTFSITDFLAKKDLAAVLVRAVHFVLSYLSFLATFVWGGAAESYFKSYRAYQPYFYGCVHVVLIYRRIRGCGRSAPCVSFLCAAQKSNAGRVSQYLFRFGYEFE